MTEPRPRHEIATDVDDLRADLEFERQELERSIRHDYSTSETGIVPLDKRRPMWHFAGLWTSELDAMRRHGALFVLTCHPFLSGRPHRVEVLRGLIEHARAAGDVEFVSCREAARRARADGGLPSRRLEPVVVDEAIYPEL